MYAIYPTIVCDSPIFQDNYIKYTCVSGYQYGFSCTLSCIGGFDIVGPKSVVCDSSDASPPFNNTFWNFGSPLQEPACNDSSNDCTNDSNSHCPDIVRYQVGMGVAIPFLLIVIIVVLSLKLQRRHSKTNHKIPNKDMEMLIQNRNCFNLPRDEQNADETIRKAVCTDSQNNMEAQNSTSNGNTSNSNAKSNSSEGNGSAYFSINQPHDLNSRSADDNRNSSETYAIISEVKN